MALDSYSALQAAISVWLDGASLSGQEATLIALAENEINAKLAEGIDAGRIIRPMVTRGPLIIDAEYADLPDSNMVLPISIEVTDYTLPWKIEYLSPDAFLALKVEIGDCVDTSLPPSRFTVLGDELRFWPVPAQTWTGQFIRFDKLPSLSSDVTTNWVLASHANVYLYGTLAQAELMGWNDGRMANLASMFQNACDGLLSRYPVQPSQASLRTEASLLGANAGRGLTLSSFLAGNI